PGGVEATIRTLADRLALKHHSAVELIDRLEAHGYVRRSRSRDDRRRVLVTLLPRGEKLLEQVARDRIGELRASGAALVKAISALCAFVALVLLRLIGLFTNLFYFGRWSSSMVSPVGNHLGVYSVLVPVVGALIIGVMARYGSERIRGHGIPEAIEAILINGSRVEPKVALLKPISSAISIGSGGPFGAEGPIIMTGGAFGSMIAQLFHLTSAER